MSWRFRNDEEQRGYDDRRAEGGFANYPYTEGYDYRHGWDERDRDERYERYREEERLEEEAIERARDRRYAEALEEERMEEAYRQEYYDSIKPASASAMVFDDPDDYV